MSEETSSDIITPTLRGESIVQRILREYIWRPAARKNDWRMFVVVGRERMGKSLTCASILQAVDPDFDVGHAHFEAVPFLEDISNETDEPGRAAMLDEAGVAFGNRTWQDRTQVRANQALQTARDDNRIIGLTLPRLEELDSQLMGRIHLVFKAQKISDGDWVELKPLVVDPTRLGQGEEWKKFPKMYINGRVQKVRSIKIGPPTDEFIGDYQPKKADWKGELFDEVIGKYAGEGDDEGEDGLTDPKQIADHIIDEGSVEEYIGENNGQRYLDSDLIALEFGVGDPRAKKVKKAIQQEVTID